MVVSEIQATLENIVAALGDNGTVGILKVVNRRPSPGTTECPEEEPTRLGAHGP